jgi:hypothetical protein
MADSGRGQSDERRGRRRDILAGHDDGDRRLDGATSLGLRRLWRSATDDGAAVTKRAAAVTGRLRSTAWHEAAPRRIALLRRMDRG